MIRWLPAQDAAAALGAARGGRPIPLRTLRSMAERDVIKTKQDPNNARHRLYAVGEGPATPEGDEVPQPADIPQASRPASDAFDGLNDPPCEWDETTPVTGPPTVVLHAREPADFEPPATINEGAPYFYDGAQYIFAVPAMAGPFCVPRETVRDLCRAYSNSGGRKTINELARHYGWPRSTVVATLRALRKTHDSLGWPDEDIAEMSEDDLVTDENRAKENRVIVAADRKRWEQVKKTAEKAERWEHFFLGRLADEARAAAVEPPPRPPLIRMNGTRDPLVVLTHATDLHYGKTGWKDEVGEEYSRAITRERVMDATSDVMARAARNGRIVSTITAVGGDWFHFETPDFKTTRGTPQDPDGTLARVYIEGCNLMRDHMNAIRQWTPRLIIKGARSNHAENLDLYANHWLAAIYESAPDVEIEVSPLMRQYVRAGGNLVGITHGHSTKDGELSSLMAAEAPEEWGASSFRMWMLGHLHVHIVNDDRGTMKAHLPSLAGTDRWHHASGYVKSNKGMAAYLLHEAGGVAGYVVSNVNGPRVEAAA